MATQTPDIPNIQNNDLTETRLSFKPLPVVLFPVRLETRFFAQPDNSVELCVRVYPDKVHIDSHEAALTADEVTWGKSFWEQTWRAGRNKDLEKAAWRQLAERYDASRAAWIARALKPLNKDEEHPTSPIEEGPLPHELRFPDPATQTEAWMRAPSTSVLPNMWVVLGYKENNLVVNVKGKPIRELLSTGPDPSPEAEVDEAGVDTRMKWMVDFREAVEAGMGIRAPMSFEQANAGLDFLLVMGIKDTLDQERDWAPLLEELFDAHHYTSGLGFVSPGTPSNNTPDAPSGFSSKDSGNESSFMNELYPPKVTPGDSSNADKLTAAFALRNGDRLSANLPPLKNTDGLFSSLPNSSAKDQLDAEHMNRALWQATLGYSLSQMLGPDELDASGSNDQAIALMREHFIRNVSANGPLPTLRVGKQPYGVLPVTSLDAWKPMNDQEKQFDLRLCKFLIGLRAIWRRNYQEIPRLGRTDDTEDASGIDIDLAEVLSMEATSSGYLMRNLMGRHYLEHLWPFLSSDFFFHTDWSWHHTSGLRKPKTTEMHRSWFKTKEVLLLNQYELLMQTGMNWTPRVWWGVFSPWRVKLNGALVQEDQNPSLRPNYIRSLLEASDLSEIHQQTIIQPPPRTLLYLLLRHSMLLEYGVAASRLLIDRGLLQPEARREPELVNFQSGPVTQTIWSWMDAEINVAGSSVRIAKYLSTFDLTQDPALVPLAEFRASLTGLESLDVARLEQLMTGTLDLCSHRLDAWISSFATKRLDEIRKTDRTGVLIGGYGWVMNLKMAAPQTPVETPWGEQGTVYQPANNPGFIHTPSLTQAATAAILRSGNLAHKDNQSGDDLLAIDLSSERVRLAMWLLDGVRQGQPLGALLGYRFERRLQETGLAKYIALFRELAPLVARKLEHSDQPVEAIAANNVADGLELLRRWQWAMLFDPPAFDQPTIPFGQAVGQHTIRLPRTNEPDFEPIRTAFTQLAEAVDAVSDALIAESVYQIVRGNPSRAASTVESVAGGETPPPELEVVQTPRTGIALTHRIAKLFSGDQEPPPENHFRARTEPHLNAWAAKLLPDPARVHCLIERLDAVTGDPPTDFTLDRLGLAPLDYVYAGQGEPGGAPDEIEQRILYQIINDGEFPQGTPLRISPARKSEWGIEVLSWGEFSELLRTTRKLFAGVRWIDAADLNPPERSTKFSIVLEELHNRATLAEGFLKETLKGNNTFEGMNALLLHPDTADLKAIRKLLLRSASFGLPGAVPLSASGDSPSDRESLLTQALTIQSELTRRDQQLEKLSQNFAASGVTSEKTDEERRDYELERLRIVFGKSFLVLPRFTLSTASEFKKALENSTKVQENNPLASTLWFQRVARVREGAGKLNSALQYSEALDTGEKLKLTVAQLPYSDDDRWVALPLEDGKGMTGGKLSVVVQSAPKLDESLEGQQSQQLAGLLIDEWVEVVPSVSETTGIALQYDRPNSAAPQTILIAVPPDAESAWTVSTLQQVLLETLDLARIRLVENDNLNELAHFLPALYFAYNTQGDTVSTDFATIRFW